MSKKVALETIQNLVQEMTKANPDQSLVKKLMLDAGLPYEADLIKQMGSVLSLVSQTSAKKVKEIDL